MKWYRVSDYVELPAPVEVVRETAKMLVIRDRYGERRVSKAGSWERYHPTLAEAYDDLIERATTRIEAAHAELDEASTLREKLYREKARTA